MIEALLLGFGLAMDAFAVSIVNGIKYENYHRKEIITTSITFGLFQGMMPLIGYFLILPFIDYVEFIDHWIVFAILGLLGLNMIKEGFEKDEFICNKCELFTFKILISEAIATSIDALSVGVSLPLLSINPFVACLIICVITTLICMIGHILGRKLGLLLKNKAVTFGGIILILIGLKTLVEHLSA